MSYSMKCLVGPTFSSGSGPRQVEQFNYDEGTSFQGLWAEYYGDKHMEGFPEDEGMFDTTLDKHWGTGQPSGLGAGNDWSMRLTGYLDLGTETQAKDYEFKIRSDDGITVTIGDKAIVNCFGEDNDFDTELNCDGRQIVEKTLFPGVTGLQPITIEYSENSGSARFNVKWDAGIDQGANDEGNFTMLGPSNLAPNLGLLTSKTTTIDTNLTRKTSYSYPNEDAKARELMASETVSHVQGTDSRQTSYEYNGRGQVTKVTTPTTVTVNTYVNGTSPSTWVTHPSTKVSCLSSTVVWPAGQEGVAGKKVSESRYECDAAGDTTREERVVDAIEDQPAQTRVTTTAYDALGRASEVNVGAPSSAVERKYSYDLAGRTIKDDALVDGSTRALNEYEYFPTGNLKTEKQPDPGNGGLRPQIHYTYDWADLQLTRSDPRSSSWVWTTDYDASNRVTEVTSPSGLITSTEYFLVNAQDAYDHKTVVTAPSDVSTTTTFDVLGRKTKEQVGTQAPSTQLRPTTYEYDQAGNLTKTTLDLPTGQTDVVSTTEYNAFGQVEKETAYASAPTAKQAVTDYHYNAAGLMDWVDGPRSDANDKMLYTYDAGQLTKVAYDGVTIPGSSVAVSTEVKYDMAGEHVWMKTPLDSDTDMVRRWAYDEFGRVAMSKEIPGIAARPTRTTSYTYNGAGWLTHQSTSPALPSSTDVETLRFAHDNLGRITSRWADVGGVQKDLETYSYDTLYGGAPPTGTKNVSSNANATVTQWNDSDGRTWKVTDGSQTTQSHFGVTTGLLCAINDAAGRTSFSYEANGLLDRLYEPLTNTANPTDCSAPRGATSTTPMTKQDASQAGRIRPRSVPPLGIAGTRTPPGGPSPRAS